MLITKYILRQIFATLSAILGVLLFLGISNRLIAYLTKAASGKLPLLSLLQALGLYIPEFLAYLLPLAFYLSLLFVFSKLAVENELIACAVAGLGNNYILRLLLSLGFAMALVVAACTLWLQPWVNQQRESILAQGQQLGFLYLLTPGSLQVIGDGKFVFYTGDADSGAGTMQHLFIAEQDINNQPTAVTVAGSAKLVGTGDSLENKYLVLYNGQHIKFPAQEQNLDFQITEFGEYGRKLSSILPNLSANGFDSLKSTRELLNSDLPADNIELQWRLAMPIMTVLLAWFAALLIKNYLMQPRINRFSCFWPGLSGYFGYMVLLLLARHLALPFGLWPVHILIIIILILYGRKSCQ